MGYIEELKKITPIGWLLLVTLFSYSIAAGIVFLFAFRYSVFINLSDIKLILLSLSLTLPVISFNSIVFFWASKCLTPKDILENKIILLLYICFVLVVSSIIYFLPVIWKIINPDKSAISAYRDAFTLEIGFIIAMLLLRFTLNIISCGEKTGSKQT